MRFARTLSPRPPSTTAPTASPTSPPARTPLTVDPHATARRDLELTSLVAEAGTPAGTGVQKLDAFVVRSEREGNAKALMEQRRLMNLPNSLSSHVFGDVAEGSVGEFLKTSPASPSTRSAPTPATRASAHSIPPMSA